MSDEKRTSAKDASMAIERVIEESGVVALRDQPPLMQAITLARGMQEMRSILTEDACNKYFMPLQGSTLGFITDKDQGGGYPVAVVREVVTEALLRGFRPIGNEFNIISGRFYGAKHGFERIVHEYPGVSSVEIDMGVPHLAGDKGALVPCEARWLFHGEVQSLRCASAEKPGDIDTRIAVKVNGGMGPDAIVGKATRKLYARVYQRLTGCSRDIVEADPSDVVQTTGAPVPSASDDGRRIKLGRDKPSVETATREPGEEG